jgi:hypothetical protein
MSRGPGRVMRTIGEAITAQPERRFTLAELTKLAYPGAPAARAHLVAVGRAVRTLEAFQGLSAGKQADYSLASKRNFKTVRAFDPNPTLKC